MMSVTLLFALAQPVVTAPPPAATPPSIVTPSTTPAPPPSAGPRPYSELPPASTPGPAAVDRPSLPERGMGGEAWSARVRARFEQAQSRQGSLDGGWTVADASGLALYVIQLADAPGRELEGVWRESPQPGLNPTSGLFSSASRQGEQTVLSFTAPRNAGPAELVLTPSAAGWAGRLTIGGTPRDVRLTPVSPGG